MNKECHRYNQNIMKSSSLQSSNHTLFFHVSVQNIGNQPVHNLVLVLVFKQDCSSIDNF